MIFTFLYLTGNYDSSADDVLIDLSSNPLQVLNKGAFGPVIDTFLTQKLSFVTTKIDISNTGEAHYHYAIKNWRLIIELVELQVRMIARLAAAAAGCGQLMNSTWQLPIRITLW